ncbi:hypothetical protein [Cryobacterium sp. Y11]|jgi:hypothetical protein|uniref:hypothetical protein n=1 Tax=Cryobacterium sp. Y11 TaxID=2045016 RepID=UPI0011B025B3|nr:hypothetical protein [Cryobacterium sp. Y11]
MKLTAIDPPTRSFSRWLTDEEIGRVIAHKRSWRQAPDGSVFAGKIRKTRMAASLEHLGAAAVANGWASRPRTEPSDSSGPTHMMWGIIDARTDAEIAAELGGEI